MGKFNRFVRLKGDESSGFRQIEKVTEYKNGDRKLLGKGLCAAMSMQWLADGTVPTTEEEFGELAELQRYYEKLLKEFDSDDAATQQLATKLGLQVTTFWPVITRFDSASDQIDKAIKYWGKHGSLGEAMTKYLNGELTDPAPRPPFVIGLYQDVLEYVALESASPKQLAKDLTSFTGGHAVALQRYKREDGTRFYEFFDPNAGVYEIEPDSLTDFFDTLYACYCNFHAEEMKRRKKAGTPYLVTAIQMSLKLWTIHNVQPRS